MGQAITHQGVVEQINGKQVRVKIISQSACSACHAKGACTASDTSEKIIDAITPLSTLKIGDIVTISTQQSTGSKAVFLGYGLPFLVLLTVLIAFKVTGYSETLSGLISLASLAPYYFVLYLFRNKIQKSFQFEIK